MKISHMRYIVEVSEWNSINKAAQHLYINQQQLSRIIAAAEEELGITLFDRNTKGIFPTEIGKTAINKFRHIIDIYDSIASDKVDLNKPISGKINLYTEINIWTSYVELLRNFTHQYPNIQISIFSMASESILEKVAEDPNGIGLITDVLSDHSTPLMILDSLEVTPISQKHAMVYGSNKNEYLKNHKTISLNTLCEVPLIDFKPYATGSSPTERIFQNCCTPNIRYSVSDISVFYNLVEETNCLFVAFQRPDYITSSSVLELPLRDKVFYRHNMVSAKTNSSDAKKAFMDYYLQRYKNIYSSSLAE